MGVRKVMLGEIRIDVAVGAAIGAVGYIASERGEHEEAESSMAAMEWWMEAWRDIQDSGRGEDWWNAFKVLMEVARHMDPSVVIE